MAPSGLVPPDLADKLLEFTSCFESGNLRCVDDLAFKFSRSDFVVKAGYGEVAQQGMERCCQQCHCSKVLYDEAGDEYLLFLDNDLHSRGHTQWFYFVGSRERHGPTVGHNVVTSCHQLSPAVVGHGQTARVTETVHSQHLHKDAQIISDPYQKTHVWGGC